MVRKYEDQTVIGRPEMYGGQLEVTMRNLLEGPDEMNGKGRLFSILSIPVGGSIGHHQHKGESEVFYVLKGTGEFEDEGEMIPAAPGDILFTPVNGHHALRNTGSEPLDVIALILYE